MSVKGRKAKRKALNKLNASYLDLLMKMELPVHQAYEALGTSWFEESHMWELYVHAKIVLGVAQEEDIKRMGKQIMDNLGFLVARKVKLGKFGLSGGELRALREALDKTIPWLVKQPTDRINAFMKRWEKEKNK